MLLGPPPLPARLAAVARWAETARERGQKLVTVAAPPGPGVVEPRPVPAEALTEAGDSERLVARAIADGFRGLGVLVWADNLIAATSDDVHARLETVLSDLCASQPVAALCLYSRRAPGSPPLQRAVAHHSEVDGDPLVRVRRTQRGVALDGEIDSSNSDVLAAALTAVTAAASPTVRVDLSGLRFLSARGAGLLESATAAYRAGGGVVELHLPAHLARVLRLCGVDPQPDLQVTIADSFGRRSPGD